MTTETISCFLECLIVFVINCINISIQGIFVQYDLPLMRGYDTSRRVLGNPTLDNYYALRIFFRITSWSCSWNYVHTTTFTKIHLHSYGIYKKHTVCLCSNAFIMVMKYSPLLHWTFSYLSIRCSTRTHVTPCHNRIGSDQLPPCWLVGDSSFTRAI